MAYDFSNDSWKTDYQRFLEAQQLNNDGENGQSLYQLAQKYAPANALPIFINPWQNSLDFSTTDPLAFQDGRNMTGKLVEGNGGFLYKQYDQPLPVHNPKDSFIDRLAEIVIPALATAGFGSGLSAALSAGAGAGAGSAAGGAAAGAAEAGAGAGWVSGFDLPMGSLWGDAAVAGAGAGSALPDSYWSMLADSGGVVSDAPSAAAGTIDPGSFYQPTGAGGWESYFPTTDPTAGYTTNLGSANLSNFGSGLGTNTISAADAAQLYSLGYSGADIAKAGLTVAGNASGFGSMLGGAGAAASSASPSFLSNLTNYLSSPQGLLSAGSNLYSAISGSNASRQAADAIRQGAQQGIAQQQANYAQIRADNAPYMLAGAGAIGQLSNMLSPTGSLMQPFTAVTAQNDPGYQFGLNEGQKALERSAAAKGNLLSGATQKGLNRFSQDYATQHFNDAFSRDMSTKNQQYGQLSGLAGLGQNAASATGNAGISMANQNANLLSGAGNASAAGGVSQNNAITSALSNIINNYNQQQMLNQILSASGRGF